MIGKKTIITEKAIQDLEFSIQEYEDEYLKPFVSEQPVYQVPPVGERKSQNLDAALKVAEGEDVSRFLSTPCPCGQNCQQFFSVREVLDAREDFRLMSWSEQFHLSERRNCIYTRLPAARNRLRLPLRAFFPRWPVPNRTPWQV